MSEPTAMKYVWAVSAYHYPLLPVIKRYVVHHLAKKSVAVMENGRTYYLRNNEACWLFHNPAEAVAHYRKLLANRRKSVQEVLDKIERLEQKPTVTIVPHDSLLPSLPEEIKL